MDSPQDVAAAVREVSKLVTETAGIQLGEKQFQMVESRLKIRMLRLGIDYFFQYAQYLKSNLELESQALVSFLTTHYSYFFREFAHFEFLLNQGLRRLIEIANSRKDKTIYIWSAACSKGQEVYSLAMFFEYHLKTLAPDVNFEIWGTDIDPESVDYAKNGVYKFDEINQSPAMYLQDQWVRGQGSIHDFSKVKASLKSKCHFAVCNLLKPDLFLETHHFDLILCRNVYIYFNSEQIKKISEKLMKHLNKDGLFILGVSETLNGLSLKAELIGPSVYRHEALRGVAPKFVTPALNATTRIIDVLCVDDSDSIHVLLAKILQPDNGFRIKATAKNGREALNILKTQRFDVITLDLHMPQLDGVGFLKEYTGHQTPVMVLSSINRDDTTIAQQAIQLGAADYVEKPSLSNLAQAGNEIRSKLKMVINQKKTQPFSPEGNPKQSSLIPSSFKKLKVLAVEDASVNSHGLSQILSADPQFYVMPPVEKLIDLGRFMQRERPDVIALHVTALTLEDVEILKRLHSQFHVPMLVISSVRKEQEALALRALESGAVDFIQKTQMTSLNEVSKLICERIKVASTANLKLPVLVSKKFSGVQSGMLDNNLILMGASTGGTEALKIVLEGLPAKIPPILIVQHIPAVFSTAFAQRLNHLMSFEVKEASDGDEIKSNRVLIAPGGKQMGVRTEQGRLFVRITEEDPVNRHRPSVDFLFQSVHRAKAKNVIAVVLTGMGDDGARQMKALRDQGARTIAQDQNSSVVYGMPKEAIESGGAEFILPLTDVAHKLVDLCSEKSKSRTGKAS